MKVNQTGTRCICKGCIRFTLASLVTLVVVLLGSTSAWAGGAAYTTFDTTKLGCHESPNGINCNNYDSKDSVYINGGPTKAGLADGCYYFAVLVPGAQNGGFVDGDPGNLSDLPGGDPWTNRVFHVSGHVIEDPLTSTACNAFGGTTHVTGTDPQGNLVIQLSPYDDTTNPGGVYIAALCQVGATKSSQCKFDAFRVPAVTSSNCTNDPGSTCCTFTQGCLGANNSVCTCTGDNCNNATGGTGYLPAATNAFLEGSGSCNPLPASVGSIPLGISGSSVTVDNLCALEAELPATGSPGRIQNGKGLTPFFPFNAEYSCTVGNKLTVSWTNVVNGVATTNKPYDWSMSKTDQNLGGTKGEHGGTLTGYSFSEELAVCVGTDAGFNFPSSGLNSFVLPGTGIPLCTQRVGGDKQFGTADDLCQEFTLPACVSGLTVGAVETCANQVLANGPPACGCSSGDLGLAMWAINNMFDNCGQVVACPDPSLLSSGATCNSGVCSNNSNILCTTNSECNDLFTCPSN